MAQKKRIVENTNKKSKEYETQKLVKYVCFPILVKYMYFTIFIYIYFICYLEKVTYIKGKKENKTEWI